MKYYLSLFLGVLLSLVLTTFTRAAITINEVAWMGTATSQYSEWIELYNSGDQSASLKDWKLYKTDNVLLFTLSKSIAAGGYLLVERTTASAPDAVPGINDESGTFGGGGLKNSGEDLVLKDTNGNTIDEALFAGGWPAGDAKTKETMQKSGTAWITATGTPSAPNATAPTNIPSPAIPESHTQSPVIPIVQVRPITPVPVVTPAVPIAPPIKTSVPTPEIVVPPIVSNDSDEPAPTLVAVIPSTPISILPSATIVPKKSSTKSISKKAPAVATESPANDIAADQLQAAADVPKENNHIKIIILGAVAFIGIGLFLLLDRKSVV